MTATMTDESDGHLYGLEKFWAFLKYYKKANLLDVDEKLKRQLAKYKKFDDFAVDVSFKCTLLD